MSYTVDTATKVHDRQIAAAGTFHSLLIKAVDALSGLADNAPQLSSRVDKFAAPVTKIVGTPSEVQAYAVASVRDWIDVQHKFQTGLLDAVAASTVTVEVPKKAARKKR
jgi:hypothetical protein